MKRSCAVAALAFLTACGGSNPTPPFAPLLPIPTTGWAITESSLVPFPQMVQLANPSFPFPQCASASTCWISYVEMAYTAPLAGSTLELDYEIIGTAPIFINNTPSNSCVGAFDPNPTLRLLIHHGPDTGQAPGQDQNRWFSLPPYVVNLALGKGTLSVPLVQSAWQTDYNDGTAAGWSTAIANPGSIGIGLGGCDFAAHGVAVSSGVAQLNVLGFSVK